jgi:hypothetical protein
MKKTIDIHLGKIIKSLEICTDGHDSLAIQHGLQEQVNSSLERLRNSPEYHKSLAGDNQHLYWEPNLELKMSLPISARYFHPEIPKEEDYPLTMDQVEKIVSTKISNMLKSCELIK